MQAVEIEATRVHQTPSSLVEWCADTAGCKQCVSPKCTRGGKWSLGLQARLLESYLIFMGNDTAGPQGNGTIWFKTAVSCVPSLNKHADLKVKYTKSCLMCLYSSSQSTFHVTGTHFLVRREPLRVYKSTEQNLRMCAGINKRYLKKVKQVWGLELQPRWGTQELQGKLEGDPIFRTIP